MFRLLLCTGCLAHAQWSGPRRRSPAALFGSQGMLDLPREDHLSFVGDDEWGELHELRVWDVRGEIASLLDAPAQVANPVEARGVGTLIVGSTPANTDLGDHAGQRYDGRPGTRPHPHAAHQFRNASLCTMDGARSSIRTGHTSHPAFSTVLQNSEGLGRQGDRKPRKRFCPCERAHMPELIL
jgi:hypothetical protein